MCPRAAENKQAGREIDTLSLNDAATTIRTTASTFTSGVTFTEEVSNSNPS
jgi:hypothetical protein